MVTTKRRAPKQQQDDDFDDKGILAHLGIEDDKPKVKAKDDAPDVNALMAQIQQLNTRLDSAERTNMALMTAPPKYEEPVRQQVQQKAELPDPTLDPDGYRKAVEEAAEARVKALLDEQNRNFQQQNSAKTSADKMWTDFASAHSDYAEHQDRVEFAASQVVKDLQAKGIDPKRYMTTAQDKFFGDVVKRMDKVFGKPKSEDDTEDNEPASRTTGIFGGMESGGKPTTGSDDEKPGDMIADLHALQRKAGFY